MDNQNSQCGNRRVDPDPFTLISTVAGVLGAAFGGAALWWRPQQLPHRILLRARKTLAVLESEVRYLRTDLEAVEEIFLRSEFPHGRTLRLGNGALMTLEDFDRFSGLSDQIFRRLRKVNTLTLKLERQTVDLQWFEHQLPARRIGNAYEALEELFSSRNLAVENGWQLLRNVIENLEELCVNAQAQLH
jgi:hypothetical protein